ncbi:MAG: hypothetical protein ACFE8E_15135 [Candidatus Hodarchaeota archaeon]
MRNHTKNTRILLIDNYPKGTQTDRIARIQEIVNCMRVEIELKTIHFSQFIYEKMEKANGIIISGSSFNVSSFYYNEKLKKKFLSQINIIQNSIEIPIFAICFGHHLVAYTYGAQICRMGLPDSGGNIIFIKFNKTDELINQKKIPVNTHHLDFISPNDCKIQQQFNIKATSRIMGYHIIQYMQHIKKPIFSLQFHPETHNIQSFNSLNEHIIKKTISIGSEIIENFIRFCCHKQQNIS